MCKGDLPAKATRRPHSVEENVAREPAAVGTQCRSAPIGIGGQALGLDIDPTARRVQRIAVEGSSHHAAIAQLGVHHLEIAHWPGDRHAMRVLSR